jgi:hypothetical protein
MGMEETRELDEAILRYHNILGLPQQSPKLFERIHALANLFV